MAFDSLTISLILVVFVLTVAVVKLAASAKLDRKTGSKNN